VERILLLRDNANRTREKKRSQYLQRRRELDRGKGPPYSNQGPALKRKRFSGRMKEPSESGMRSGRRRKKKGQLLKNHMSKLNHNKGGASEKRRGLSSPL